jgi:hypothetical protein
MITKTQRTSWGLGKLIILLLAAGVSTSIEAATIWHVSPGGNDANSGLNWASAKQTVQAAVNLTANGDTVLVTNGVYALTRMAVR